LFLELCFYRCFGLACAFASKERLVLLLCQHYTRWVQFNNDNLIINNNIIFTFFLIIMLLSLICICVCLCQQRPIGVVTLLGPSDPKNSHICSEKFTQHTIIKVVTEPYYNQISVTASPYNI
jgi:hypothetical protein